jgi:phenylalanyl-tRNA synthetase alpha chain
LSSALHPIESKVLSALRGGAWAPFDELVASTSLKPDQVRRSLQWLSTKGLAETKEEASERLVAKKDAPELALVDALKAAGGTMTMGDARAAFSSESEFSAALGRARSAGWIKTVPGPAPGISLLEAGGAEQLRELLRDVRGGASEGSIPAELTGVLADLVKRGIVTREVRKSVLVRATEAGEAAKAEAAAEGTIDHLTPEILSRGSWKGKKLRAIDVEAKAPRFYPGRRHPVRDFIREVREAYVSMGFTELEGGSVQPAFWNFDALFIPQDHPGREMQDTFYLEGLSDQKMKRTGMVGNVAATHESGWKTGSKGWGYTWNVEEARRLVLRTHNTVLTVKSLVESGEEDTRAFAVSKVYRNENLDYKHLAEFYQMDGIIVGEGLNVRHLMGFLREFYKKLGMADVKLWPSYFPYTEPSLQIMGYSEVAKDWVELGGSGVFRPEVTRPLGVRVPVLAWGPGIERLMLLRYGLDDLRSLYGSDLSWLRGRREIASSQA